MAIAAIYCFPASQDFRPHILYKSELCSTSSLLNQPSKGTLMSLSIQMCDLIAQRNVIEQQIREKRVLFLTKKLNSIPTAFIAFHRHIPQLFQELCSINMTAFADRADDLLDLLETILDIDYTVDI